MLNHRPGNDPAASPNTNRSALVTHHHHNLSAPFFSLLTPLPLLLHPSLWQQLSLYVHRTTNPTLFQSNVQELILNSSPYELVKKGLLSLPVTRRSLSIPDSVTNVCSVVQLLLPLIIFQVVLPARHIPASSMRAKMSPLRSCSATSVCLHVELCVL